MCVLVCASRGTQNYFAIGVLHHLPMDQAENMGLGTRLEVNNAAFLHLQYVI